MTIIHGMPIIDAMDDRTEQMNRLAKSWDDAAEGYDAYFVPRFAPWVDATVSAIAPDQLPPGPILVPCCGTFPEADVIASHLPGREAVGIDLSAHMVRLARDRVRDHEMMTAIQGDAATLNSGQVGRYAAVVSVFGLQQLPEPDQALKSWASALRPGGWLSIAFWPAVKEVDGPFVWLRTIRGGSLEAEPWEHALGAILTDSGMTVLRDESLVFTMSYGNAAEFFDANTRSGPMRALANARGDAYIRELREAYVARAPQGPLEHCPAARHIVARAAA